MSKHTQPQPVEPTTDPNPAKTWKDDFDNTQKALVLYIDTYGNLTLVFPDHQTNPTSGNSPQEFGDQTKFAKFTTNGRREAETTLVLSTEKTNPLNGHLGVNGWSIGFVCP